MDSALSGFKRADKELNRILLLDLLLNGYSIEEIEKVEEVTEHNFFAGEDRKIVRIYALTREAVDIHKIYKERSEILTPTICSLQTYEMNTISDVAYYHKSRGKEHRLRIHDLGIIAQYMVITPEVVISSKKARPISDCEYGFESFMDYVLYGKFEIGNWIVSYNDKNKEFAIRYKSTVGDSVELVYLSCEYSKEATFNLVLYLIRKVYDVLVEEQEFKPDWFVVERWEREEG